MDGFLNEFYRLRNEYRGNKKKCINCKRSVGTKFEKESFEKRRIYRIKCGDEKEPCELNKEYVVLNELDLNEKLLELKKQRSNIEDGILELKNKILYGLIKDETFDEEFEKMKEKLNSIENDLKANVEKLEKERNDREGSRVVMKELCKRNKEIGDLRLRLDNMIKHVYPAKSTLNNDLELLKSESKTKPWSYDLVKIN